MQTVAVISLTIAAGVATLALVMLRGIRRPGDEPPADSGTTDRHADVRDRTGPMPALGAPEG
jgi:hypothetical protein